MKSIARLVAVLVLMITFASLSVRAQQTAINCDGGCGGLRPTGGAGSIPYLTAPDAVRGLGSAVNPSFAPLKNSKAVTIAGSQSFTYSVPLFALAGRNGLNVNLTLYYNSFIWTTMGNSIVLNADHDNPSPGFRLDFGYIELSDDGNSAVLADPTGAKHLLSVSSTGNVYTTTDSTYVQAQILPPIGNVIVATYKSGMIVTYNQAPGLSTLYRPAQFKDTNGNIFSIFYQDNSSMRISQVLDDVARSIFFTYDTAIPTQLNSVTEVSSGNVPIRTFTFSWAHNYPLYIAFTQNTGSLVNASGVNPSTINVLTGVTRPDGTSVSFSYVNWGLVGQVSELSGNGAVRYSTSYNWPIAGNGFVSGNPTFTQQTIFDGVNTGQWNYSVTRQAGTKFNPAGLVTNMSVSDPTQATTSTTFSVAGGGLNGVPLQQSFCSSSPCTSTSGNVLRTTTMSWALDASPANPRPTSTTTILEDGSTQSQTKFNSYDANGNVTDLQEYDYGSGAPGALLRETIISFASPGNNILDRPSRIIVKDGSGSTITRTDVNYDEGSVADFSSNPAGHDPAYSSAITARGNLTSMIRYTNAGGGTGGVTSRFTYDATGNLLTSQMGSGPLTTRNFSTATWYSHPDSISVGPTGSQLTTTFTYNDDRQVLTAVDANGQRTTFTYDAAGRPSTTQTPDQVLSTTSYDDSSASPAATVFSNADSLRTISTFDGLGRSLSEQILNGTTVVSTTARANDILGRATQSSYPFGPGETPAYTTFTYDPLGRTTQVQAPTVGGVAKNPSIINYSASVVTTTDPAGLQKKRYSDALGRLVRVDEPGSIGGAAASGSATISGTDLSVVTNSGNGATAGTASVTLTPTASCSGTVTDRCNTQVIQQNAAPAQVTVKISGTDAVNVITVCHSTRTGGTVCSTTRPMDSGTLTLAVNVGGTSVTSAVPGGYSSASAPLGLAQALVGNLPANSVVRVLTGAASNADGSASFTLATDANGNATNGSTISVVLASNCVNSDTEVCGAGFGLSLSGPNLNATPTATTTSANFTGGLDQILTTKYDTGTVTLGFTANNILISEQVPYGQSDTAATLAQALITKLSQDGNATAVVTAGCAINACANGIVNLTTIATGSGTNYPLALSAATNSVNFPSGTTSFTLTSPSTTFVNGQTGTLYDNGTVSATLKGFTTGNAPTETVNYGQGSTAASIAASLVAKIQGDPLWGAVTASLPAGSSSITFTSATKGTDANNYSVQISGASNLSSSFPNPSFPNSGSSTPITAAMGGGSSSAPSFDPSVVLTTAYSYDAPGNLLQVNQGQQTRTYTYDSLGELLTSSIPETSYNITSFTYKDFGAIATKTDPRMVSSGPGKGLTAPLTTTYGYDTLARPIDISYNDGTPEVTFSYGAAGAANNAAGRLTLTTDVSGSKSFQYDSMGRVTQMARTIAGVTYPIGYGYNLAGELTSTTYPSGRVIAQRYDPIGRFTEVDNNGSMVYAANSYNAAGQILTMSYGNGMSGAYSYNPLLQLKTIQYGSGGTNSVLDLTYGYGGASDNGQIQTITDNNVSSRSTNYTYDELGRLKIAQTTDLASPNTWKLEYTYDRYGNRRSQVPAGGTAPVPLDEVIVDPSTNHLFGDGETYDAAGDMTFDGSHSYTYDAERRITHVDGAANTFAYDGGGFRIYKNGTIYIASGGSVIAEYVPGAAPTTPNAEYIYAGGQRVATIAAGAITYRYTDHLSIRASADSTGTVTHTYGHLPFGETWYDTGTPDRWRFTTYEHDAESGLDYAMARFDSTRIGRFMSVDPLSGEISAPQSLNRYSYVTNDPINQVDPTGLAGVPGLWGICMVTSTGDCIPFGNGACLVDGQPALNCQMMIDGGFGSPCATCGLQWMGDHFDLVMNGLTFDLRTSDPNSNDGSGTGGSNSRVSSCTFDMDGNKISCTPGTDTHYPRENNAGGGLGSLLSVFGPSQPGNDKTKKLPPEETEVISRKYNGACSAAGMAGLPAFVASVCQAPFTQLAATFDCKGPAGARDCCRPLLDDFKHDYLYSQNRNYKFFDRYPTPQMPASGGDWCQIPNKR